MSQTKRLLVPFDPAKPEWNPSEFLIPAMRQGRPIFVGLTKGGEFKLGRVVFIGQAIGENDLFAKLVASGAKIESAEETLATFGQYVKKLQSLSSSFALFHYETDLLPAIYCVSCLVDACYESTKPPDSQGKGAILGENQC
jgi:hypothetical protein